MAKFNLLQGKPSALARQFKEGSDAREHAKPRPTPAPVASKRPVVEKAVVEPKGETPERLKKWRKKNKAKLAAYMRKWRAAQKKEKK